MLAPSALSARALSFAYPSGVLALRGIDLDVAEGQFVALLGPSGCGKSTLLRLIAGLLPAPAGALDVAPELAAHQAFVFQQPSLLPWRSVAKNVALPLELLGQPADPGQIGDTLARLGLGGFEESPPSALSGGMAMRVSLARALITRPRLLLMDEPFGALDDLTRQDLGDFVHGLWRQEGWTCIFVTHNVFEAVALADRIVIMGARPGRVVADVTSPLPRDRGPALREDPAYHRLCGEVLGALRRGAEGGGEAASGGGHPPAEGGL